MDFLAGYGSESGSSDDGESKSQIQEEGEESVPGEAKADEASDGSDSESDSGNSSESDDGGEEKDENPETALPSVDDLFASTSGPDFLSSNVSREFIAPSLKRKSLAKDPEEVARQKLEKKKKVYSATAASGVTSTEQKAIKFNQKEEKKASSAPNPFMDKKEKEARKQSAKDRVKNQRLKGQAGIGEDFRQWKTEEEMRMRQQFD